MNFRSIFGTVGQFLLLLAIQILFLKNLALFGLAFCFIYLLALLLLPVSIRSIPLMIIAFMMGISVDVFYETIGMHAAAATFLAFLRNFWLKIISPSGGYDEGDIPSIRSQSTSWFVTYAFPLLFAFCLVLFSLDFWGTGNWLNVLNKSFFSSIFTLILAIIVQLLFFPRRRVI
ncbi:rod shape-determining protein MreD [Algoriphagus sediminis]|uniref:Rod shape-determining protein MreD n=1 Tax=Algoriphagus sediminis TaxID=3057113 RepID=A0ABT7YED2_9BACT|nr:rod shape-determining protein MreD [Algoriphagus sediminis]MDN3204852.1 rod shape-determining protein MreD [Algoriphagus sediminis]